LYTIIIAGFFEFVNGKSKKFLFFGYFISKKDLLKNICKFLCFFVKCDIMIWTNNMSQYFGD